MHRSAALLILLALTFPSLAAPKITKEIVTSVGKERSYYLFVPENLSEPAPLVVLLHGSGRDGKVLLDHWRSFAQKNGIILAGPDAIESKYWQYPADGPVLLRDVVRDVQQRTNVDPRRVYLFGHSAGASFAIPMAMLQSTYFAAVAAHAGGIVAGNETSLDLAKRKVPVYLVVGVLDSAAATARTTNLLLQEKGFPVQIVEMPRHGHNYYAKSGQINPRVWEFLSAHQLESDPEYTSYANIPEE